jgi:hypothetical protein
MMEVYVGAVGGWVGGWVGGVERFTNYYFRHTTTGRKEGRNE